MFRPLLISALLGSCCYTSVSAQVTLDGTLGKSGALSGPNYQIGADLGQQHGSNLFHSFRDFSLQSHESATFSGPANVQNVISRVTGGNPSSIDGTLRSTIPNANLYFLNPFGIMFGPNAKLDVQGSFHASTADYLRLQDGGQFHARVPSNSLLTVAPPEAFGFLTNTPAAITTQDSHLSVSEGKTLSLIGGDLRLTGSHPYTLDGTQLKFDAALLAPGGRINLASVASQGEVIPTDTDLSLSQVARRGTILAQNAGISTYGSRGGSVFIRGGQFELMGSGVFSQTNGDQNGGVIDIQVDKLKLLQGSRISSSTSGTGNAGSVLIKADTVEASGIHESGQVSGIISESVKENSGNAGQIEITAHQLTLADSAQISSNTAGQGQGGAIHLKGIDTLQLTLTTGGSINSNTYGTGQGGSINIQADSLSADDKDSLGSGIYAVSLSNNAQAGNAGQIEIAAHQLTLTNGAQINGLTRGGGQGGSILLKGVDTLVITGMNAKGDSSGVSASSANQELEKAGKAGDVTIETHQLTVTTGGQISNSTFGTGQSGLINIQADSLTIDGKDSVSSIAANSNSKVANAGNAGQLQIVARQLTLTNGAQISSFTRGGGQGGSILLKGVDTLVITGTDAKGNASSVFASSLNQELAKAGKAGNIEISAGQLTLEEAVISSSTHGTGQGGSILIKVIGDLTSSQSLISGSSLSTADSAGKAGNIEIQARQIILDNYAAIGSYTEGGGEGGTITIQATNHLTLSQKSSILVNSDSEQPKAGNAGKIEITAPQVTLTDKATIVSSAYGPGNGGTIVLSVNDLTLQNGAINTDTMGTGQGGSITLQVTGTLTSQSGVISSSSQGETNAGHAGNITIKANQVILVKGAQIGSGTWGTGNGGTIDLVTNTLTVDGKSEAGANSGIFGNSESADTKAGDAGAISVHANTITLLNAGKISTRTNNASGGNLTLITPNLLYLQQGQITTSVTGGMGNGGNITINQPVFVVLNQGQIKAQADQGKGGNIDITSRQFLKTPHSIVSASSKLGINGTVVIHAPNESVSNSLNLPPELLDVTNRLPKLCGEMTEEEYDNLSHFFVHPRAITGESPLDLQGSPVVFLLPYFRTTTPPSGKAQPPVRQGQNQARSKPLLVMMECQKRKMPVEQRAVGKPRNLKVRQPAQ